MKQHNKAFVKRLAIAWMALLLLASLPLGVGAASAQYLPVTVKTEDGISLPQSYLIDGTTYVPFRAYCDTYGIGGTVGWIAERKTATYTAAGLSIEAVIGQPYLTANGRILFRDAVNLLIDGKTYVPVRAISAALCKDVAWHSDATSRTVTLCGESRALQPADTYYDEESLFWMARVISAEAKGESLMGKIAVGNVVMNRIASELFPSTVYDVIFDCPGGSVQFYRPGDPYVMQPPTEESILAAKIVLEGYSISSDTLFYLNPRTATSFWIVNNRPYLFSLGLHDFYA